jgi:putative phage-type endonuclease
MPVVNTEELGKIAAQHISAIKSPYTREDNYEEWLEARFDRIGSSTISSILGFNSYSTRRVEWQSFITRTSKYSDNPFTRYGNHNEEFVMSEAEIQNPEYTIYPLNWTYYSEEYPIASATPDGLVKKEGRDDWGLNETKCTKRDSQLWASHQIPPWAYAQLQWQLGVCGLKWGLVTAMIEGNPIVKTLEVEFDPEVFASLYKNAEAFMDDVKTETKPPTTGKDLDAKAVNELLASKVYKKEEVKLISDPELETKVSALAVLKDKLKDANKVVKDLEKEKKELENTFKDFSGGCGVLKDTQGRRVVITKVEKKEYVSKASTYFTVRLKKPEEEK